MRGSRALGWKLKGCEIAKEADQAVPFVKTSFATSMLSLSSSDLTAIVCSPVVRFFRVRL